VPAPMMVTGESPLLNCSPFTSLSLLLMNRRRRKKGKRRELATRPKREVSQAPPRSSPRNRANVDRCCPLVNVMSRPSFIFGGRKEKRPGGDVRLRRRLVLSSLG